MTAFRPSTGWCSRAAWTCTLQGQDCGKWTALIPAASSGETSRYGVLLVYRKKAVGAYLLERPSGVVVGLKDMQAAMAEAEAKQTSGEDYEATGVSATTKS